MNTRILPVLLFALAAAPAAANRIGIFGASGENAAGSRCTGCHANANDPAPPTIVVDDLDAEYTPGGSALFTLRVTRAATSSNTGAGFGVSTTAAGTFVDLDGNGPDEVRVGPGVGLDNEATHQVPKLYVGGSTSWQLSLTSLQEGRHFLFVGANDMNNNSAVAGDHPALAVFPFLVCDPAVLDDDGDGFVGKCDTCLGLNNPDQDDRDRDGVGDECDLCPDNADPTQSDLDDDGIGDACDAVTDDCALGIDTCSADATCTDLPGVGLSGHSCTCNRGYEGNGRLCEDINECFEAATCTDNASCTNTVGSFVCECDAGYIDDGGACIDDDECANDHDFCNNDALCTNTVGSYTCACHPGFEGDGFTCVDVDECADDSAGCDDNAVCTNSIGAFTCACTSGYAGDGTTCADIDECAADSACDANASCTNNAGSFTCTCNDGYDGDGATCADVDECDDGDDDCDDDASCTNTPGAFTCACDDGYEGNGRSCSDIDECAEADSCADNETCTNSAGSFTCEKTGCAATTPAPLGALVGLLLMVRRRRRP